MCLRICRGGGKYKTDLSLFLFPKSQRASSAVFINCLYTSCCEILWCKNRFLFSGCLAESFCNLLLMVSVTVVESGLKGYSHPLLSPTKYIAILLICVAKYVSGGNVTAAWTKLTSNSFCSPESMMILHRVDTGYIAKAANKQLQLCQCLPWQRSATVLCNHSTHSL